MKQNETSSEPHPYDKDWGSLPRNSPKSHFKVSSTLQAIKWPFSFARHTVVALSFATVPPTLCGFAALTSTVDPFQTVLWSHLPKKTRLIFCEPNKMPTCTMVKDHRQEFQICSVANRKTTSIHTHTHNKKDKSHQRTEQHQLKRWGTTSKTTMLRLPRVYLILFPSCRPSHAANWALQPPRSWAIECGGWILDVAGF